MVGIVPADVQVNSRVEGKVETLTIKCPVWRPVVTETSFEMDFAAALDS